MKKATIIFTTAFIILFAILQIANAESQLEKWEKIVKPGSPTEQVLTTLKAIDDSKNLLKLLKKRDKQLQKLRQTNIENKRVKGKYAQFRNDLLEAIDDLKKEAKADSIFTAEIKSFGSEVEKSASARKKDFIAESKGFYRKNKTKLSKKKYSEEWSDIILEVKGLSKVLDSYNQIQGQIRQLVPKLNKLETITIPRLIKKIKKTVIKEHRALIKGKSGSSKPTIKRGTKKLILGTLKDIAKAIRKKKR